MAPPDHRRAPSLLVAGAVLLLFTIWAGSFLVFEALLVTEKEPSRFSFLGLPAARFSLASALFAIYCFGFRARESLMIVRRHWKRLALCGLFCVPGYNFALYAGMQSRVPAPVASLLTALAPLYLMLLSAAFLGERITVRRAGGFLIALAGLLLIASARDDGRAVAYPLRIALTALAPLCWSIHSVLTKPLMSRVSPLLWTYLAVIFGSAPLFLLLPFEGGPEMARLDAAGWWMLLYTVVPCTVVGWAVWCWLLRHMPATSVGFTVFLNPPLTTIFKGLQAALIPSALAYTLLTGEAVGGIVVLLGVAVALWRPPETGGRPPETRDSCR